MKRILFTILLISAYDTFGQEFDEDFSIDIDGYEGPLHLLLELSKKHKIDLKKIAPFGSKNPSPILLFNKVKIIKTKIINKPSKPWLQFYDLRYFMPFFL